MWLNKFNEEYVNDNLDRKNLKNNLHNTKKLKKDCDDRNNARNRCILTKARASGRTTTLDPDLSTADLNYDIEDQLIHQIDNKPKKR